MCSDSAPHDEGAVTAAIALAWSRRRAAIQRAEARGAQVTQGDTRVQSARARARAPDTHRAARAARQGAGSSSGCRGGWPAAQPELRSRAAAGHGRAGGGGGGCRTDRADVGGGCAAGCAGGAAGRGTSEAAFGHRSGHHRGPRTAMRGGGGGGGGNSIGYGPSDESCGGCCADQHGETPPSGQRRCESGRA